MRKIGVVIAAYNLFPCLVQDRVPGLEQISKATYPPEGPLADICPLCPAASSAAPASRGVAWRSSSTRYGVQHLSLSRTTSPVPAPSSESKSSRSPGPQGWQTWG